MFNQNQIYNIFNQQQIQAQLRQMQQHHNQQIWKVSDCVKKLDDFLKSAEDIDGSISNLLLTNVARYWVNICKEICK